jgi:hypothetical protein
MGSQLVKVVADRMSDDRHALTDTQWVTLWAIAWHVKSEGHLYASVETVGKWLGVSKSTAWARMQTLERKGVLVRVGDAAVGRGNTTRYWVVPNGMTKKRTSDESDVSEGDKRPSHESDTTSNSKPVNVQDSGHKRPSQSRTKVLEVLIEENDVEIEMTPNEGSSVNPEVRRFRCPRPGCGSLVVSSVKSIDENGVLHFTCERCGHPFGVLEDEDQLVEWMTGQATPDRREGVGPG